MSHHYLVASGFGWAVGETAEAAIKKHAKDLANGHVGAQALRRKPGVFAYVYNVEAPITAEYSINNYEPVGIPFTEEPSVRIKSSRGFYEVADE